jgi:hypothetical protein
MMVEPGAPNNNGDLLHTHSTILSSLIADYNFRSKDRGGIELILRNTVTDHKLTPLSRQALVDYEFGFNGWNDLSALHMRFGCKLGADLAPEDADDRIGFALNIAGIGGLRQAGRWADADSRGQSGHG